jgi:hypothetical protein
MEDSKIFELPRPNIDQLTPDLLIDAARNSIHGKGSLAQFFAHVADVAPEKFFASLLSMAKHDAPPGNKQHHEKYIVPGRDTT